MQILFKVTWRHLRGMLLRITALSVAFAMVAMWNHQGALAANAGAGSSSGADFKISPADPHDRAPDGRSDKDSGTASFENADQPFFQINASHIRIEFSPGVNLSAAEALAAKYGFAAVDSFIAPDTKAVVMLTVTKSAPRDIAAYKSLTALSKDAHVQSAQLDTTFLPQDSGAGEQTYSYMNTQYVFRLIGLGLAQNMSTGAGSDIALIDTWVDQQHPAFSHAGFAAIDDIEQKSGNGRNGGVGAAETAAASYKDHGTRMAGILAADGPIRGVAPNANVLLYDVFAPGGMSDTKTASGFYVAKALNDAVARQVDVANVSLCGPYDGLVSRVITAALRNQVAVVAAAGNGGPLSRACYPAANEGVIAVTATDHEDRLYDHANRGSYITMAAPGVEILTAASHGKLSMATGTSFAAAHVTGMIALLRSRHPDLSVDAITKILTYSSKDIGPEGRDSEYGSGRLSALEAMILSDQDLDAYQSFPAP